MIEDNVQIPIGEFGTGQNNSLSNIEDKIKFFEDRISFFEERVCELGTEQNNSLSDIEDKIKFFEERVLWLKNLKDVLKERLENKQTDLYDKINIVSLGENCLGRVIPGRWGLIKMRNEGRLSLPFDLAVHFSEYMLKVLENDFAGYMDKENLHYNPDHCIWQNKKYKVGFNHDRDLNETDMPKLIERYTKRIENFNFILKNSNKTFFILNINRMSNIVDPIRLKEVLIRYSANFHIIILNHTHFKLLEDDDSISVIDCPFPNKEYKWYLIRCYASDEGLEFEKELVKNIKVIIANNAKA